MKKSLLCISGDGSHALMAREVSSHFRALRQLSPRLLSTGQMYIDHHIQEVDLVILAGFTVFEAASLLENTPRDLKRKVLFVHEDSRERKAAKQRHGLETVRFCNLRNHVTGGLRRGT